MQKQQGVALVVVLSLLAGTAMIGMSGMQSAIVDERLSGNFRGVVRSFSDTETLAASLTNQQYREAMESLLDVALDSDADLAGKNIKLYDPEGAVTLPEGTRTKLNNIAENFRSQWRPENYDELSEEDKQHVDDRLNEMLEQLELEFNRKDGSENVIEVATRDIGARGNASSQSILEFTRTFITDGSSGEDSAEDDTPEDNPASPFQTAIVGCRGVSVTGGSSVSRYRSSLGQWSGTHGVYSVENQPLIQTVRENADLMLGGGDVIYGDVSINGNMTLNGSSRILGNVLANKNVFLNAGGGRIQGNVESLGSVLFQTSTRVDGFVSAKENVTFENWSASVGQGITAGGSITSTRRDDVADHIDEAYRGNFYPESMVSITPAPTADCDNFDFAGNSLLQEMQRYQSELDGQGAINVGAWPNVEWRITPTMIERFDKTWNINEWVEFAQPQENTFLGEFSSIYRVDSLNLTSNPTLSISGGDVILVVDGNFTSSGGSNALRIDDDSSLTLFVGGRVDLGSNINMSDNLSISTSGKPTLSIFSAYESDGYGLKFTSSNQVVANVYAPFTGVSINSGADFLGSLRAREVEIDGDGDLVYDQDLANVFSDVPDESFVTDEWCSFSELSPLTVVGAVGSLKLPSSRAEFNGRGVVPDITVAAGEASRYSDANTATDSIREGIPAGVFDGGNSAANFDEFISRLRSTANTISGSHNIKGKAKGNKRDPFGRIGEEEIWFVDGDLSGNNLNGAGILVVNGDYDIKGNPAFDGLIIVLGDFSQSGGGGDDFNGALLVAPYFRSSLTFLSPDINFNGGGGNDFNYDADALSTAFELLDDGSEDAWNYCDKPSPPSPPDGDDGDGGGDDDDGDSEDDGEFRWDLTGWR